MLDKAALSRKLKVFGLYLLYPLNLMWRNTRRCGQRKQEVSVRVRFISEKFNSGEHIQEDMIKLNKILYEYCLIT